MKIKNGLLIIALLFAFVACNSNKTNTTNENAETESVEKSPIDAEKVAVYYFHSTRRCETCMAVESVSSKTIKEFYNGAITFESLNLEEEDGEKKAAELGVSSSALIIKRGDQQIDITAEAFMYGRQQADKLKALIKEKIEPLKEL